MREKTSKNKKTQFVFTNHLTKTYFNKIQLKTHKLSFQNHAFRELTKSNCFYSFEKSS